MLTTAVSIRLTSHFDSESIKTLVGYIKDFQGGSGLKKLAMSEAGVMFVLYKMNEYSHWIITGSIIWIVVVLFILVSLRRTKSEKQ